MTLVYGKPDLFDETCVLGEHVISVCAALSVHTTTFQLAKKLFYPPISFLASQDALEVMRVTE